MNQICDRIRVGLVGIDHLFLVLWAKAAGLGPAGLHAVENVNRLVGVVSADGHGRASGNHITKLVLSGGKASADQSL